jgi:hypothetical protein
MIKELRGLRSLPGLLGVARLGLSNEEDDGVAPFPLGLV